MILDKNSDCSCIVISYLCSDYSDGDTWHIPHGQTARRQNEWIWVHK